MGNLKTRGGLVHAWAGQERRPDSFAALIRCEGETRGEEEKAKEKQQERRWEILGETRDGDASRAGAAGRKERILKSLNCAPFADEYPCVGSHPKSKHDDESINRYRRPSTDSNDL